MLKNDVDVDNEFEFLDLDDDAPIPENPFDFARGGMGDLQLFEQDPDDMLPDVEGNGSGGDYTPAIDEGDFLDPAQRFLFKLLKTHIRSACNVNSRDAERAKALEWIFVPGTSDKDSIEFDPCCLALGGRPVVIRARTMHQFWQASILLKHPLPTLAAIPPSSIMSEIRAIIGPGLAESMARDIWYFPSIPLEILRAKYATKASDKEYQTALENLDANGYIATLSARAYFISRNPALLTQGARNRFQFSTSILEDY